MRCKNCGTYNDDNRYICETCGSPLYDEDNIENESNEKTMAFTAVEDSAEVNPENNNLQASTDKKGTKNPQEKKSVIVIAVLIVVLIAIIASVIVVAQSKSKKNEDETSSSISSSQTTTEKTTISTTQRTTERTTEKTTTTTTTTTTTQTTAAQNWYINATSSGGGSVSGGNGEFRNGDKVTLTAKPDSGYEFDGWYSNGMKVSNKEKYTFTANENISYTAVFNKIETDSSIEELHGED